VNNLQIVEAGLYRIVVDNAEYDNDGGWSDSYLSDFDFKLVLITENQTC
jgi:hypothetical protein